MSKVIPIFSKRIFDKQSVMELVPILERITKQAFSKFGQLKEELRWIPKGEPLYAQISDELEHLVETWALKMVKLGCSPRGLWQVDFEAKDGRYSWKKGSASALFIPHQQDDLDPSLEHIADTLSSSFPPPPLF